MKKSFFGLKDDYVEENMPTILIVFYLGYLILHNFNIYQMQALNCLKTETEIKYGHDKK